jgi:ABC-type amino acid transport substrate-binding protein
LTHFDGTQINTGVTTVVEDYCRDFLEPMKNSLKQEDQIPNITVKDIDNYDSDNQLYPRYNGLETGKIQIDCGSEIIDINTAPNKKIFYSNPFFETGLKLLINKESFDEVTNKKTVSKTIFTNKIKNSIKIGLFEKRINVVKILDEQGFTNYFPYKNARELKDDLALGKVNAYVDDSLRMEEFFRDFINNLVFLIFAAFFTFKLSHDVC